MRAQKVLDKKLADELDLSEEAELDEDGQPIKKVRKKRAKKVSPIEEEAEPAATAAKAVKAKGTKKKKAGEPQSDESDAVPAVKKPVKAKASKAKADPEKLSKPKATKKKGKAAETMSSIDEVDSASGSEATERFDFESDEDPEVAATIIKRGRKKATSHSTSSTGPSTSSKAKVKGKTKATLSPLSSLSEASEDEVSTKPRMSTKIKGSIQALSNQDALLDISADEATDGERSLAYAAAAEGSMEMQRLDMDDESPDGIDSLSKSSHSPSLSKDMRPSDVEPPSPTKRRRKSSPTPQEGELDTPGAAPESRKIGRPRKGSTTSPKASRSKQGNPTAKKPIQIVEISD